MYNPNPKLLDGEILRVVNGSKLYGLEHALSDDDYLSVFVEEPGMVFSSRDATRTRKLHGRAEGERTLPGDVDGVGYALRHFLSLVGKGNPTLMAMLFCPSDKIVYSKMSGLELLARRDLFVSKLAAPRFRGYMHSQKERLFGRKVGHIPNRPEITEKYGYDTKYAMHIVRLAYQGIELLTQGEITLPMPAGERMVCKGIREGSMTKEQVETFIQELEERLAWAESISTLPEEPDWDEIFRLSMRIHEEQWRQHNI